MLLVGDAGCDACLITTPTSKLLAAQIPLLQGLAVCDVQQDRTALLRMG